MAVKNATFKPLLVPTKRETKYITNVETTKPITKIKTEEAEYTAALNLSIHYSIYIILALDCEISDFRFNKV